ncbi:MAG TPA: HEAT repeat domain-containing protein [Steroidobacteraceae bacterium]|nr:HEAT repeat domain-containing protein [Steroidobacteraceae bacterium]
MAVIVQRTLVILAAVMAVGASFAAAGAESMVDRLNHPLWTARLEAVRRLASGEGTPAAVPALVRALSDVQPEVRRATVDALLVVGKDSEQAVAGLLFALKDPDWVVRRKAAVAFHSMTPATAARVVPNLIEALSSANSGERVAAALALSGLAPHSRQALPALVDSLSAPEWELQAAAVDALGALGPDAAPALPALARALRNHDWAIAEQTVEALSRIGRAAVPALADALSDDSLVVRWGAARALAYIGADSKEAVPALGRSLNDPAMQVRWAAAKALWAIGRPEASTSSAALAQALQDKHWVVRWSAARAMGAVASGDTLDVAVDALAAALRDGDSRVCEAAAFSLEQIGPAARRAVAALDGAATFAASKDAKEAVCKVIDVGPVAQQVLMDSGWTVRWASVRALGIVGSSDPAALPALVKAMEDDEAQVRGVAALAIGQFRGPMTAAAVAAVTARLRDDAWPVRKAAALALGSIGPRGGVTPASLQAARSDQDQRVREAAAEAITKLTGTQR